MFVHAAELGWKQAERLICQGCQHGLPRLDPEADVPAILLVGYWTFWEKIRGLFHKVYMLKRLSVPPPCGPEWMEKATRDILSSLKDCLRHRRGEKSEGSGEPEPASACPPHHWDRASQRERQDTSENLPRPGRPTSSLVALHQS